MHKKSKRGSAVRGVMMPFSISFLLVCLTQIESDTSTLRRLDWLPFAPRCHSPHTFVLRDWMALSSMVCKFQYFLEELKKKRKKKHLTPCIKFRDVLLQLGKKRKKSLTRSCFCIFYPGFSLFSLCLSRLYVVSSEHQLLRVRLLLDATSKKKKSKKWL